MLQIFNNKPDNDKETTLEDKYKIVLDKALDKIPHVKAMLIISGKQQDFYVLVTKLIRILMSSEEGREFIKELGFYEQFSEL